MAESALRSWLSRYKPEKLRLTLQSGEQREIPRPSSERGQWAQLERAVISLSGVTYIEALVGATVVAARALAVDDEGESDESGSPPVAPASEEKNPFASMVSALPTITQLLVDAGDASAQRHQDAYKMAFESMIQQNQQYLQLVKLISDRLGGVERAWHQLLMQQQQQSRASGDDENDAMVSNLLTSIVAGSPRAVSPPPPPSANGSGSVKGNGHD